MDLRMLVYIKLTKRLNAQEDLFCTKKEGPVGFEISVKIITLIIEANEKCATASALGPLRNEQLLKPLRLMRKHNYFGLNGQGL